MLAETDRAGRPAAGMFSVLPIPNERAADLVADPRLPVVSFTGSGPVGAQIRSAVPDKHVTLELGGNAAAVVCGTGRPTRTWTGPRPGSPRSRNYQAGQSCIAVQRVFVHDDLYDDFVPRLVDAVEALPTGDPSDEATDVGPLISEAAADRVEAWVGEARRPAARNRGRRHARDGATYRADRADRRAGRREGRAPRRCSGRCWSCRRAASDDRAAFAAVNDSQFGLQAGVFTHNAADARSRRTATLEVGGVIVGDVPSYRADQMPYGGVQGLRRRPGGSAQRDGRLHRRRGSWC